MALVPVALALAQPKLTNEQLERVKQLGNEGKRLFDEGKYEQAVSIMMEVYSLLPVPKVMLNVAKCYEKLGQLQLAKDFLARAQNMNQDPVFAAQIAELLQQVEHRLGLARIRFLVAPKGVRLQVDGVDQGTSPRDILEVEPGMHRIRLTKPGLEAKVISQDFPASQITDIVANLEPPAVRQNTVVVTAEPSRISRPWPWVAVGTGGATLIAGSVLVALASVERDNVRNALNYPNDFGQIYKTSMNQARKSIDRANAEMTAGLTLLSLGGAALATGIVLFFVPRQHKPVQSPDEDTDNDQVPVVLEFAPGGHPGYGAAWQGRF